ncbi:hypothetical protein SK128_010571 [Halocaridina rubra]|uniref:Uncharacterized protein n=1 Tax=Halocaridina rubra TaxID=373956 RepID=A0AAN8XCV7_HALRR
MENIMSGVNNGYPDTVDEKLEATQLYTQTSKQRVQISDNNKLGVPVKSGDCDCDYQYKRIPEKLIGENAVEPALSKEISAQNDKDEIEANTSDEEIPSTQDVIRNVEEDMDLVRRLRQKSEHSQGVIDLVSQSSFPGRFSNEPVSSIGNKNLTENMKKPIKPVSESEDILESQKSIFEDMCHSVS